MVTSVQNSRLDRDEIRQQIMTSADGLCRTIGFSKMTVADIATELEISPAYIYKFFPSKLAIIQACAERRLSEKRERIGAASRTKSRAIERIESVLNMMYSIHKETLKNQTQIYKLVIEAYEEKWVCIRYFREFLLKLITDLVEEGIRKKEFQVINPLDTARILLDSMTWVIHPLLFQELDENGVEERIRIQLRFLEKSLQSS